MPAPGSLQAGGSTDTQGECDKQVKVLACWQMLPAQEEEKREHSQTEGAPGAGQEAGRHPKSPCPGSFSPLGADSLGSASSATDSHVTLGKSLNFPFLQVPHL